MNIKHFKKRLIYQHQTPIAEAQAPTQTAKDDLDDDGSSNSSGSSASISQKQETKKEVTVQPKVARKRAVCRSKFRHNSLKIFKLGNSIPTSLCKSKEPYNVITEKNLQLCCENKRAQRDNNKKEESVQKESITEQIINSIEGSNKRENFPRTNSIEHAVPLKVTGKHSLPAIIAETPVKRQRNSLSRSSEDEQKSSGTYAIPNNRRDQTKSNTESNKQTTVAHETCQQNEHLQDALSSGDKTNSKKVQPQPEKAKVLDRRERISPDSTSILDISNSSIRKQTNDGNLPPHSNTAMAVNISMPHNTSIIPIMLARETISDYKKNKQPPRFTKDSVHGPRKAPNSDKPNLSCINQETSHGSENRQSSYENRVTQPYLNQESPYTNNPRSCPIDFSKSGDPHQYVTSVLTTQTTNSQFSNNSIHPKTTINSPIDLSVKEDNALQLDYRYLPYYEHFKHMLGAPAVKFNEKNIQLPSNTVFNGIYNIPPTRAIPGANNILTLATFPEIQQQLSRLNHTSSEEQSNEIEFTKGEKQRDAEWMSGFLMALSRSQPSPMLNNIPTGYVPNIQRLSYGPSRQYLSTDWTTQPPISIAYCSQDKAPLNVPAKKTYRPRARKKTVQQDPKSLSTYIPNSLTGGSYPTDSRYIPPKTQPEPKPLVPKLLEHSLRYNKLQNIAPKMSSDARGYKMYKEPHILQRKPTLDGKTVIIKDKSMEVTKGYTEAELVLKENERLSLSESSVTIEKISDVVVKNEKLSDEVAKPAQTVISSEELNLFKELLRQEDKEVYNKVLKKLIGVKETRTVPEVITIEDEEDRTTTQETPRKDIEPPSAQDKNVCNPSDVTEIDNIQKLKGNENNSDHNENYREDSGKLLSTKNIEISPPLTSTTNTNSEVLIPKSEKHANTVIQTALLNETDTRDVLLETPTPEISTEASRPKTPIAEKTMESLPAHQNIKLSQAKAPDDEKNIGTVHLIEKGVKPTRSDIDVSELNSPKAEKHPDIVTPKTATGNNEELLISRIEKDAALTKSKTSIPDKLEEVPVPKIPTGNLKETLKLKIPISNDRHFGRPKLKPQSNYKNVTSPTNGINRTDVERLNVSVTSEGIIDSSSKRDIEVLTSSSTAVEDISSDEEVKKPITNVITYEEVKHPEYYLNAPKLHCFEFIDKDLLSKTNERPSIIYTMPVGPAAPARSKPKDILDMMRIRENKKTLSCKIKVNFESSYRYSPPNYPSDESVSQSPKNCRTPERVSPIISPIELLSPILTTSGIELRAKSGANWKSWINEEGKKEFLDPRRPCDRRQSVETISSVGSDYSPSSEYHDNYVRIKIDSKWYRAKKTVLESIPKGKMSYNREKNYLIRYFDDIQVEQFIKNVNINLTVAPDFFKPVKDRGGGYLSDGIFLTPIEVPEKNEIVQLSDDISFTKDDYISDPELYVEEVEKVERFAPKDFLGFYKYVTGYQIVHNHDPISFQTFLTMHNTNRIKSFFKKYLLSILENKYVG